MLNWLNRKKDTHRVYSCLDLPSNLQQNVVDPSFLVNNHQPWEKSYPQSQSGYLQLKRLTGSHLKMRPYLCQRRDTIDILGLELAAFDDVKAFFHGISVMQQVQENFYIESILTPRHIVCDPAYSKYAVLIAPVQGTLKESFNTSAGYSLQKWIKQLATGLKHIHARGWIHGSFSSDNIWASYPISSGGLNLKIGGFTQSTKLPYLKRSEIDCEKLKLLPPPEVIAKQYYTKESDIFNFGIVLWEMFSLKCAKQTIAASKINDKDYRRLLSINQLSKLLPIPVDVISGVGDLIQACWRFYPQYRPTATEIVKELNNLLCKQV